MTTPRYFLFLSYCGTQYSGWQIQPNAVSVQSTLEAALSTILRVPTEVTGCGRTDAGVHARYYAAHFDAQEPLPHRLLEKLNSLLPDDIAIRAIVPVHGDAHARYDAYERSYEYHIRFQKDPFSTQTAWFYPQFRRLDTGKMQESADILLRYRSFFPFCKSDSGLDSFDCELRRVQWQIPLDMSGMVLHITANRFLRGMVRLIVGACVHAGTGQLSLPEIEEAMQRQQRLRKSLSVPPQGLFLTDVKYPDRIFEAGFSPAR